MKCVAVEYSVQQFIYQFMAQILSMAQIMSTTGFRNRYCASPYKDYGIVILISVIENTFWYFVALIRITDHIFLDYLFLEVLIKLG